jgi:hypothetical protein
MQFKEQGSDIQRQVLGPSQNDQDNVMKMPKNPELFSTYEGTFFIYDPLTKKVTQTDTQDIGPLRYLSPYYPPSIGNMFRYVMYKIPLGGTKRKRKRRRTKHRK